MNSDYQTGDTVIIKAGKYTDMIAVISVMESAEKLHLKVTGLKGLLPVDVSEIDHVLGFAGPVYPLTLNAWDALFPDEKEQVVIKLVDDYGDFKQDFDSYIAQPANLNILFEFIKCAERVRKTHSRYGSKAIFEELRWHHAMASDASAEFKINNNYTADLARVATRLFPELEEFFKLRKRAA